MEEETTLHGETREGENFLLENLFQVRKINEGKNILEEIIFLRRRILIREELLKLINISVKYNLI